MLARVEASKVGDEPVVDVSFGHEDKPVVRPTSSHSFEAERGGPLTVDRDGVKHFSPGRSMRRQIIPHTAAWMGG